MGMLNQKLVEHVNELKAKGWTTEKIIATLISAGLSEKEALEYVKEEPGKPVEPEKPVKEKTEKEKMEEYVLKGEWIKPGEEAEEDVKEREERPERIKEVVAFVRESLSKGLSTEQIKQELVSGGWTPENAVKAIALVVKPKESEEPKEPVKEIELESKLKEEKLREIKEEVSKAIKPKPSKRLLVWALVLVLLLLVIAAAVLVLSVYFGYDAITSFLG